MGIHNYNKNGKYTMLKLKSFGNIKSIMNNQAEEIVYGLAERSPFSSGELSDSISYEIVETGGNWVINISVAEYGLYQDKGVVGVGEGAVRWNTPYQYKPGIQNRPSPRHFMNWIVRAGIAPRDNKGRFVSRSSLAFYVAYNVHQYGITPKNWINPNGELDKQTDELVVQVYESIWDDFEDEFYKKNKRY